MKVMLKFLMASLFFLGLVYNSNGQTLDSDKSIVTFNVSNMALNTVEGSIKGMKGTLNFNPNNTDVSIFDVCIDASTIDTDNTKRDDHLKNEDFFEVDKYPSICFKSSQIIKTVSGFTTKGILTMHGVSKTIEIPFTYKDNELVGAFKIKRYDYKIGEGTGKFMVGNEISITILAVIQV